MISSFWEVSLFLQLFWVGQKPPARKVTALSGCPSAWRGSTLSDPWPPPLPLIDLRVRLFAVCFSQWILGCRPQAQSTPPAAAHADLIRVWLKWASPRHPRTYYGSDTVADVGARTAPCPHGGYILVGRVKL